MESIQNILNILKCPNCNRDLYIKDKGLKCDSGHFFDFSKQSYINLLLANMKKTKDPGDDETMAKARNAFLEAGYFERLRDQISQMYDFTNKIVLDAGCGIGYYTKDIADKAASTIGVDISKHAVKIAAKNDKKTFYIISSIFNLPIKDNSIDCILNIFAPKPQQEFQRVLKNDGVIIEVIPGENHLKEIKTDIYKQDAKPILEKFAFTDFDRTSSHKLTYMQNIHANDYENLLKMTPFWYNGGQKLLESLKAMQVTFDFVINIWRRK